MPWEIKYDRTMEVVEVVYEGMVTGQELKCAVVERIDQVKCTNASKVLVDAYKITGLKAKVLDVYEIVTKVYVEKKAERTTKMALIKPQNKQARELMVFYINVCMNRGWYVKDFTDRLSAIDWLSLK